MSERPVQCDAIADELTELALGTLSGHRRSEVLDHVESCQACRAELAQLSAVAEALQQLAPQVQPPLGFELRVAERLHAAGPSRTRRPWRVGVLAAAAAVVLSLGLGVRAVVDHGPSNDARGATASDLLTADLTSHDQVVGQVLVAPGDPAWMFVTVHDGGWQGRVSCEVTLSGGRVEWVGAFELDGDYGSWAVPLQWNRDEVRSAQLVSADGTVVASAQLRT